MPKELAIVHVGRGTMWANPFKLMGDVIYVNAGQRQGSKVISP